MKLVTYKINDQQKIGAVVNNQVIDLSDLAANMLAFIDLGDEGLNEAKTVMQKAGSSLPIEEVQLMAPIPSPRRNVMCLGLNYAEHAKESLAVKGKDLKIPEFPIVFNKATTAVTGPYDSIPFDTAVSSEIDWEVELGIVLGKSGKNISEPEAMRFVYGYTIINDISARDLQMQGKQYFKGKSLDGSCPMGPYLVTADEIADPHNLQISCRVNGETKQDSSTKYMIFNIPATIAYLSKGMTMLAGDVIATGTPDGVGFARTPPEFMKSGDVLESEIEAIGVMRNKIG